MMFAGLFSPLFREEPLKIPFGDEKVLSAPALLFATFFDFHKIADVVSTGAL